MTPDPHRPDQPATGPRATARLQFHKGFTLDDACAIVPYLAALGISHVYASPLLAAAPGSTHGYDTIDPTRIDPERGGLLGLQHLSQTLRAHEMGLILDIVPNHMGIASDGNPWWDDVLAHGRHSRYAGFFDIDWTPPEPSLRNRVLLPFLGTSLEETLQAGEIALEPCERHGFVVRHAERHYPIRPQDHADIETRLSREPDAFDTAQPRGRIRIASLLARQHYRLCSWRAGNALINWRRFFNVTSLAALRMEDEAVFEAAHALIFDLYQNALIDGVRCDHVDGLTQPGHYARRLIDHMSRLRPGTPIVYVEKILRDGEYLPSDWPVTGTTGYEFLEDVSRVLHDPRGEAPLTTLWHAMGGTDFASLDRQARQSMLDDAFRTERARLVQLCSETARILAPDHDITADDLDRVLCALCIAFPTYRSYCTEMPGARSAPLHQAIQTAARTLPSPLRPLCRWVEQIVDGTLPGLDAQAHHAIAAQFEHLTAPLAAKAGEDTAFYRTARALGRVDVGGDPGVFSQDVAQFHAANARRSLHTMLTTSTHDHKRGADSRARLAVLSEPEARWPQTARSWLSAHAILRDGGPDPQDTLMLYQIVIGAWPMAGPPDATLRERLQAFLTKALREAARHTRWDAPDQRYEQACARFLDALITPGPHAEAIGAYVTTIARAGALNSLSQTLLRATVRGMPDLYQGCELWDLSLVDPDNRRPVDFAQRAALLATAETLDETARHWPDGAVQQRLLAETLALRRRHPAIFAHGTYQPLATSGPLAEHLIAFLRQTDDQELLVLAPRLPLGLAPHDDLTTTDPGWRRTWVHLPTGGGTWESILTPGQTWTGPMLDIFEGRLPLGLWLRSRQATGTRHS